MVLAVAHRLTNLNGRRKSTMTTMDLTGRDLTVHFVEAMIVTVLVNTFLDRSIDLNAKGESTVNVIELMA